MLRHAWSVWMVMALVGCSSNDPPPADAGRRDARADAAAADAATADAATDDAATADAATDDAATDDAATVDAASDDAGSDAGTSCDAETPCGAREYCVYDDVCGRSAPGHCAPRPEICTEDCPGVCGCDGRFYCNECLAATMGVDVDPDGTCTAEPDCGPFDARGEGRCALFFGYAWDGRSCVGVSGCSCVGTDCGRLFDNLDDCNTAFADCRPTACGGFLGSTCGPSEWCDYTDSTTPCGFADGSGLCQPRPVACPRIYTPVCGCDGNTYENECVAHLNGQDIQSRGTCDAPPPPPPPAR